MAEFMPTRAWVKEQMKISWERGAHADFLGLDFSGLDLSNLNLTNSNFDGAKLVGTNLHKSCMNNVSAAYANFRDADMHEVEAIDADFEGSDFRNATMYGINAYRSRFVQCDMRDVDAEHAVFDNADFSMTNMRGANLRNAQTDSTTFYDAMLFDAVLSDDIHRASLYCANIDALTIPGIPLTFLPTHQRWLVRSGSWRGTVDEFRTLIDSGDWATATFIEDDPGLAPVLATTADLCDAFAAARPDAVAKVRATAEKWEAM